MDHYPRGFNTLELAVHMDLRMAASRFVVRTIGTIKAATAAACRTGLVKRTDLIVAAGQA